MNKAAVVAPTVQRDAVSAKVSAGRRNAARKPSSVGDTCDMRALIYPKSSHLQPWGSNDCTDPSRQKKAARNDSRIVIPCGFYHQLSHNDIQELAGNEDLFHDLFTSDRRLPLLIGERLFNDELFCGIGGHGDAAAKFSVDLHGDLKFLFFRERGVVFRPRSFEQASLFAQHLPEFVGEIGCERCKQENKVTLNFG